MVEHDLAKVGVASSSLVFRSNEQDSLHGCPVSFGTRLRSAPVPRGDRHSKKRPIHSGASHPSRQLAVNLLIISTFLYSSRSKTERGLCGNALVIRHLAASGCGVEPALRVHVVDLRGYIWGENGVEGPAGGPSLASRVGIGVGLFGKLVGMSYFCIIEV